MNAFDCALDRLAPVERWRTLTPEAQERVMQDLVFLLKGMNARIADTEAELKTLHVATDASSRLF